MTKKPGGKRDQRAEPDSGTSQNFRVDRVFPAMPHRARPNTTSPPPVGDAGDAELSLRRQLSRLQHQLADAQRELANKDDELAAASEKRRETTLAYDVLVETQKRLRMQLEDAAAYRLRSDGVDKRLQEALAKTDELAHQLARERSERAAMARALEEATASFERSRHAWKEDMIVLEEQHVLDLAQLDEAKDAAIAAAERAMASAIVRERDTYESELEAIRVAQGRALSALRGELEPKVAHARNLAAEMERAASELTSLRAEHARELSDQREQHERERTQLATAHATELAAQARAHGNDLARAREELDAARQGLQQAERNATHREQLWEQTMAGLRDSQKKLQQELAETKERWAVADSDKLSFEVRLAAAQQLIEKLGAENRELRERAQIAEVEARHNVLDRERFAAYLEEGLAMLGALPESEAASITIEAEPPAEGDASRREPS